MTTITDSTLPITPRAMRDEMIVFIIMAALLALGIGGGAAPPLVAAGLAFVAGLCSLARLRPSIRNPQREETQDVQPAMQVR